MRILPPNLIPAELWKDNLLVLPESLSSVYINRLKHLGLFETASAPSEKKNIYGGKGAEETREHFSLRFGASAGRIEFTSLDPGEAFENVSDSLLRTFSDGEVALLDVPCGTGATVCALICTLISLRQMEAIPRLPLTIHIGGGDISETALEICHSMLDEIHPAAQAQGIKLSWDLQVWDATRSDQTARLVDDWFAKSGYAKEFVVIVSNFSGALKNAGAFEAISPCFEQILARLHNKSSTFLWIEPAITAVKKGLRARVLEFFKIRIPWFLVEEHKDTLQADYEMRNPVNGIIFRSNVVVEGFRHEQ